MDGITPLSAMPTHIETDHTNDNQSLEHPDAAFLELARGLELYIDEITRQPTFDRLFDLPIEIRHEIYKYYLLDDRRSLAARQWPFLYWAGFRIRHELEVRVSVSFLPMLCLVNKTLFRELTSFLFCYLIVACKNRSSALHFFTTAARMQAQGLEVAQKIRRLTIFDMIGVRLPVYRSNVAVSERLVAIGASYLAMEQITRRLNSCRELRQITIGFAAHVEGDFSHTTNSRITAESVGPFLAGFDLRSILRLR
ncbi:hypothetical protein OPT61_g755 [Boeremia exigua]|uniref:Uncharacterized protein n=1 Tax=Boeremia exigua TaxID=749465 RepID=A0ACC2IST9_9PLEO|nr:hypothetical protein OPT61_g755 [Boeremia exigua]